MERLSTGEAVIIVILFVFFSFVAGLFYGHEIALINESMSKIKHCHTKRNTGINC
ncbi:MAG: hypothetical protein AB7I27_00520 [Bacteriovoracaceae bacterium]